MKSILPLVLLLISISGLTQSKISTFNECQLFDYIHSLSVNNYKNSDYRDLKNNWEERKHLLLELEEYLFLSRSEIIKPKRLENQDDDKSCPKITSQYEELWNENILKPKNKRKSKYYIRKLVQKPFKKNIHFILFDLCGLINENDSQSVNKNIAELKNSYTLEYLYQNYKTKYVDPCRKDKFKKNCLPQFVYDNNLKKIAERINSLDNLNYSYYESYYGKPNIIKGFEAQHDNDVFMFLSGKNQDREYTGGFKFTFATDYFKWRFHNFFRALDNVLSYQTISLGGYGYTPYIRYRNNFELADSLHNYDRPFGSYLYFERAKNRTWRKGLVRQRGEFQIGSIGISEGRKIQAKLHEDVIHKSQFVHGWDKQIGDGGRLVFQLNQKIDFLLCSTSNRYKSIFRPKTKTTNNQKKYAGHNLIMELDARLGGFYTSGGIGIRYSTLDFLKQSGTNQILSKPNAKNDFGWKLDFGINYRYVIHNTMLEGLGYFNTFEKDNYDKVNPDYYVLSKDQIQRNLIIIDFGVNIRWRKTTFFYRYVLHTLEYESPLSKFDFQNSNVTSTINPDDIDFYNETVIKEHNSFLNSKWFNGKTFYGYGTLGMSWFIE